MNKDNVLVVESDRRKFYGRYASKADKERWREERKAKKEREKREGKENKLDL